MDTRRGDVAQEERVRFCLEHGVSSWREGDIRLLSETLVRGPEGVLDLRRGGSRLVASLVEKADSEIDCAELVPLGLWGDGERGPSVEDERAMLADAVAWADGLARTGPRSVLSVPLGARLGAHRDWICEQGFRLAHESLTMRTADATFQDVPPPAGTAFVDWHPGISAEAIDQMIREAFRGIPGIMVMDLESLRERLRTATPPARVLVAQHAVDAGDMVVGLVRTRVPDEAGTGFIHLLVRAAKWKGRGVGAALLSEACRVLSGLGAERFELDVASMNTRAIALYTSHGFATSSVEASFVRPLR